MTTLTTRKLLLRCVQALGVSLLFVTLGAGMLLGAPAPPAQAHATLVESAPAEGETLGQAPSEAKLTFNESIQLVEGSVRLFAGGDDPPVELEARVTDKTVAVSFPSHLDEGSYALSYRIVSADGHPVSGALTFHIGEKGQQSHRVADLNERTTYTLTGMKILSALQYFALLMFVGLVMYLHGVSQHSVTKQRQVSRVLRVSAATSVVSTGLLIPVSAMHVSGAGLVDLLNTEAWWAATQWNTISAALLVLIAVPLAARLLLRDTTSTGSRVVAVMLSAGTLGAPLLVGHTQTVTPRPLMYLADFGHLAAGSVWVGGLTGLLLQLAIAWSVRTTEQGKQEHLTAVSAVQRFSAMALWSVIVLACSGLLMAVLIVGDAAKIFTTGYGLTLLLKVSLVLPVVGLAAYNRRVLLPAVTRQPVAASAWRLLNRTLSYELVILAMIVVVTGSLTQLSPNHDHGQHAHEVSSETTSVIDEESQGLRLSGDLEPGATGVNTLTFSLDFEGEEFTGDEVSVQVTNVAEQLGPLTVTPIFDEEQARYVAEIHLPVAGEWEMKVLARVDTFTEPILQFKISVS